MSNRNPPQPPPFHPQKPPRTYSVVPVLFVLAIIGTVVGIWVYADDIPGLLNHGVEKLGDMMPADVKSDPIPVARQDINAGVQQIAEPEKRGDPEAIAHDTVRRFLKAAWPDAEFDEVKWWPIQPLRGSYTYAKSHNSVIGRGLEDTDLSGTERLWNHITVDGQSVRLSYIKRTIRDTIELDVVFMIDKKGDVADVKDSRHFRLPGESLDQLKRRLKEGR